MSNPSTSSGGIGFGSALLLLFIGLKLGQVIDWSWLWVMSPLWIPLALFTLIAGVVVLFLFMILIVVAAFDAIATRRAVARRRERMG